MRLLTLFLLGFSLLLLPACIEIPEIVQVPAPAAPSATPQIVLPTAALPTPSLEPPTQAPLADQAGEPTPALIEMVMFSTQNGWGRSEESIYRTGDAGKSWQRIEIPLPETHTTFNTTFFDTETAFIVSSDPENPPSLLFVTQNGGQTWAQTTLPNLAAPSFPAIVAVNPQTLFLFENLGAAAGSQGVALSRSTDGGQTWEKTFAHIPGETSGASLPFGGQKSLPAFLSASLGFIGGGRPMENDIYFFRTEDAGRSWQPQPLPVPAEIGRYMALVQTPITFPGDGEDIVVPVSFSLAEGDPLLVFFASSDRGQSWQASAPLAYGGAYHFIDPLNGWVHADGTLYATTDSGQTWQAIPNNLPVGASINSLSFSDAENGWALVFELDFKTYLYSTRNGGQTWERHTP